METAKIRVFRNECLDLSGRSLEVIVGETSFHVNEELICAASPFFDTAFSGEWNESKTRTIELTEHDAQVFRTYMHWLYLDKLAVRNDAPGFVGNEEYIHLAKAYVLGDFLSDGQFKDAVMDARTTRRVPGTDRDRPTSPKQRERRHPM